MDASNNNTKAFTDAIKKMAAEECKKIDEETRLIKKQRLASVKSQAIDKYKDYIQYETARIQSEKNKLISSQADSSKKELAVLRREICDKVFLECKKRIEEFSESEAYKDFLKKSVSEVQSALEDKKITVLVREQDMALLEKLDEKYSVKADSSIKLGGVKAVGQESGCLADNTLDLKLEAQKEWFLANSELKI